MENAKSNVDIYFCIGNPHNEATVYNNLLIIQQMENFVKFFVVAVLLWHN